MEIRSKIPDMAELFCGRHCLHASNKRKSQPSILIDNFSLTKNPTIFISIATTIPEHWYQVLPNTENKRPSPTPIHSVLHVKPKFRSYPNDSYHLEYREVLMIEIAV